MNKSPELNRAFVMLLSYVSDTVLCFLIFRKKIGELNAAKS